MKKKDEEEEEYEEEEEEYEDEEEEYESEIEGGSETKKGDHPPPRPPPVQPSKAVRPAFSKPERPPLTDESFSIGSMLFSPLAMIHSLSVGDIYKDETFTSNMAACMENINKVPSLGGISYYLVEFSALFRKMEMNCNASAAAAFGKKIYEISLALGAPWSTPWPGLCHKIISDNSLDFPSDLLTPYEEQLDSKMRYLRRFAEDDFLIYTLYGEEVQRQFADLETTLDDFVYAIYGHMNVPLTKQSMGVQKIEPYKCNFNLRAICDSIDNIENPDDINSWIDFSSENNMSTTEDDVKTFQIEVSQSKEQIKKFTSDAQILSTPSFLCSIENRAFKIFWQSQFPDAFQVSRESFEAGLLKAMTTEYSTSGCLPEAYNSAEAKKFVAKVGKFLRPLLATAEGNSDTVTIISISKYIRWIPHSDDNIVKVLEKLMSMKDAKHVKQIPPTPLLSPHWNDEETDKKKVLTILKKTKGWVCLKAERNTGRSTMLQALCHELPTKDFDLVYISFQHALTEAEMIAQAASQLCLKKCSSRETFQTEFQGYLSSLRSGSVIIFDDIEPRIVPSKTDSFAPDFLRYLGSICIPHKDNLCIVLVGMADVATEILGDPKSIEFPLLSQEKQLEFASTLLPADPASLVSASQGLAGRMAALVKTCCLSTIRAIAAILDNNPANVEKANQLVCDEMLNQLNADEKLLVNCLPKGIAPFDLPLAWALCKDVFSEDFTRWWIAWRGLSRLGWITGSCNGLVFSPYIDMYHGNDESVPLQSQWDIYYQFWAKEVQRMHNASVENENVFEYFTMQFHHFKSLFSCFPVPPPQAALPKPASENAVKKGPQNPLKLPCSNNQSIALIVAGYISSLLAYRFSNQSSCIITKSIVFTIGRDIGIEYIRAATEYAEQLSYDYQTDKAIEVIRMLEIKFTSILAVHNKVDRIRLWILHGFLLNTWQGRRQKEALEVFTKAAEELATFDELNTTKQIERFREEVAAGQNGWLDPKRPKREEGAESADPQGCKCSVM